MDGLKQTLNGKQVNTSAFGRTILMAGLLNVGWHMKQREVHGLGGQTLGGRDKWRLTLLRAFDNNWINSSIVDDDTLHRLAHMALHVDMTDCEIYAGAQKLLDRSISAHERTTVREKMTDQWVSKASARDAVFHALKFLCKCLLDSDDEDTSRYCARDDYLMSRPWVLYLATLVVWSYGYASEGPIEGEEGLVLRTPAEQRRDMCKFLRRVGSVREPNELEMVSGRNRSLGLLLVLRDTFRQTRWEMLGEQGAGVLEGCIEQLCPVDEE